MRFAGKSIMVMVYSDAEQAFGKGVLAVRQPVALANFRLGAFGALHAKNSDYRGRRIKVRWQFAGYKIHFREFYTILR
jgi:hypothetical protein